MDPSEINRGVIANEMGELPIGSIESNWWLCSIKANADGCGRMYLDLNGEPFAESLICKTSYLEPLPERHARAIPTFSTLRDFSLVCMKREMKKRRKPETGDVSP